MIAVELKINNNNKGIHKKAITMLERTPATLTKKVSLLYFLKLKVKNFLQKNHFIFIC